MKIIEKYTVDETTLLATNLTETATEWDVATTYAAGDEVYVVDTKTVYVSAIDDNLGNDPATSDAATWIIRAAMNKWAAFDAYLANQAARGESITYTIAATSIVNGIAFFGLEAESISVTVTDGASQSTTIESDLLNLDHVGGSFYDWFTGGRPRSTEHLFLSIPYYGNSTEIEITITSSSVAKVGQVFMGRVFELGKTLAGINLRSQDFSRYNIDQYGNFSVIKGAIARRPEIDVFVDSGNVRRGEKFLRKIQGIESVFVGSEELELGLFEFGILTNFEPYIDNRNFHHIKLELRGLI